MQPDGGFHSQTHGGESAGTQTEFQSDHTPNTFNFEITNRNSEGVDQGSATRVAEIEVEFASQRSLVAHSHVFQLDCNAQNSASFRAPICGEAALAVASTSANGATVATQNQVQLPPSPNQRDQKNLKEPQTIRKSYTIEMKIKVAERALEKGRNMAAKEFGLNGSMVGRWMRSIDTMKNTVACGAFDVAASPSGISPSLSSTFTGFPAIQKRRRLPDGISMVSGGRRRRSNPEAVRRASFSQDHYDSRAPNESYDVIAVRFNSTTPQIDITGSFVNQRNDVANSSHTFFESATPRARLLSVDSLFSIPFHDRNQEIVEVTTVSSEFETAKQFSTNYFHSNSALQGNSNFTRYCQQDLRKQNETGNQQQTTAEHTQTSLNTFNNNSAQSANIFFQHQQQQHLQLCQVRQQEQAQSYHNYSQAPSQSYFYIPTQQQHYPHNNQSTYSHYSIEHQIETPQRHELASSQKSMQNALAATSSVADDFHHPNPTNTFF
ncbi:hypothetical protein HK100_006522 [Physocladia obscura]|uniref:Uncharacterized protein n=1 Tax=Physocladia obscura TaxID=109957 RepID=A0AAD5T5D7_9FUNG|nr:hypothetical protein HK100_006522 [Physocladia obscura]